MDDPMMRHGIISSSQLADTSNFRDCKALLDNGQERDSHKDLHTTPQDYLYLVSQMCHLNG